MALRNAFENLLTEATGRRILAAVTWARDPADRLRVIVDNAPAVISYFGNTTGTDRLSRLWYDSNAVHTVDTREMLRQQSLQAGNLSRQKWTYVK